ncbi:hypothetical protein [Actinomycetospora chibensis]|uniref:Uncharacterized protein n=1 Tax=Actinomycetospora chibensis TaxID=663606 RepID=A0ABV9R9Y8_9PSEU|nr:hypothetical protein [Actinomycetospora chibensis]MDD7925543.1 hypothetical protein [Actinomycetospora chibensis]
MSSVESVNVGVLRAMEATTGASGIDKRPTSGAVRVAAPAPGVDALPDEVRELPGAAPGSRYRGSCADA